MAMKTEDQLLSLFYTGILPGGELDSMYVFLNMYSLLCFGFVVEFYLAVVL